MSSWQRCRCDGCEGGGFGACLSSRAGGAGGAAGGAGWPPGPAGRLLIGLVQGTASKPVTGDPSTRLVYSYGHDTSHLHTPNTGAKPQKAATRAAAAAALVLVLVQVQLFDSRAPPLKVFRGPV